MEDTLITFETAVLAKEKGFDWKVLNHYKEKESINHGGLYNFNNAEEQLKWIVEIVSRPTQGLLQRWLRDIHKILVISIPWKDHSTDINDEYTFKPMIVGIKTYSEYNTYEEALEVGLYEGLQLIK